jgi:hypothetical protein
VLLDAPRMVGCGLRRYPLPCKYPADRSDGDDDGENGEDADPHASIVAPEFRLGNSFAASSVRIGNG